MPFIVGSETLRGHSNTSTNKFMNNHAYICKMHGILKTKIRHAYILIWDRVNFVENYQYIIYNSKLPRYSPFTRLCAHIFCIYWRHRNHYDVTKALLCTLATKPYIVYRNWYQHWRHCGFINDLGNSPQPEDEALGCGELTRSLIYLSIYLPIMEPAQSCPQEGKYALFSVLVIRGAKRWRKWGKQ